MKEGCTIVAKTSFVDEDYVEFYATQATINERGESIEEDLISHETDGVAPLKSAEYKKVSVLCFDQIVTLEFLPTLDK